MAVTTTYLLVSGVENPDTVRGHEVLEDHGFEHQKTFVEDGQRVKAVRFAVDHSLDEDVEMEPSARKLSSAFPDSSVLLCTVEERFDQVERVQATVFLNGSRAGEIDHGYVFNVGSD